MVSTACLPSILMIQVRILLKPTVFSVKCVIEKNENKQNEAGGGPFLEKTCIYKTFHLS